MNSEEDIESFIFIQGLENAVLFKGKANPKAIIGKVIAKFPEVKKDMQHYMNSINNIVKQINDLNPDEQENKLRELNPKFFEKSKEKKPVKEKKKLPELSNVDNKIITRFEPAPSGYLHLGHLYAIIPNFEYVNEYGGEFILRIADTNPDNISKENYDKVIEDIKWITDNYDFKVYYQSRRIELYYEYLEKIINKERAYVCFCDGDTFKQYNDASKPCPHRNSSVEENIGHYKKMLEDKYKQGQAVVRFKGDLDNKNPALRDFTLARINKTQHPMAKDNYVLWPTMHLAVAVDDIEMKLTHVIRGKDHEINMLRQKMIHELLGLKSPEYFHLGRVKFTDITLSKTEFSNNIKEGKYTGWDDPRIPTLVSFKRRGYRAKAFREMIVEMGAVSKRDSKISYEEYLKNLNFHNKKILEKESDRFFFISDKVEIEIMNKENIDFQEITHPKHPEDKSRGFRKFKLHNKYYIEKNDFDNLEKNDIFRMMHFGNFEVVNKEKDKIEVKFLSKEYSKEIKIKSNIHFLEIENYENCKIIMPDNSTLEGISENTGNIKIDETIQFERFGFVRFDRKEQETKFYYFAHR